MDLVLTSGTQGEETIISLKDPFWLCNVISDFKDDEQISNVTCTR